MDEKTKELVAIGAAVAGHCQPCLEYHVAKAKEVGLEESEIREAIAVGQMVEEGSMSAMKSFAAGVFDTPTRKGTGCCENGTSKGKGCCA